MRCSLRVVIPILFALAELSHIARADTEYYHRTIFDNSLTPDRYYYSSGKASAPSKLTLDQGKLPVDPAHFVTGPNSLLLEWTSVEGGGWTAEVEVPRWRNRDLYYSGNTLYFYCFSDTVLSGSAIPFLVLRDTAYGFTKPLNIAPFTHVIPANQWIRVSVPVSAFESASLVAFDPHRVQGLAFVQNAADKKPHRVSLDEFRIDEANVRSAAPRTPSSLRAQAFERHIDVSWSSEEDDSVERYVIYRSDNHGVFRPVGIQPRGTTRYADWVGAPGQERSYKVTAGNRNYEESPLSEAVTARTRNLSDDELLSMVQEASFRYYWEGAHPVSGLTRENLPGRDEIVAIGASGFGIMTVLVGAERKFITHDQALRRLNQVTKFLERADRFHGAWPHFLDGATGRRLPVFGLFENGGDLVETAFLMQGLLAARGYFDGSAEPERILRERITRLWESVEWDWYRRQPDSDALFWHWSPEYSWYINHRLTGWNEVMIVYLLAIASPTHGVPAKPLRHRLGRSIRCRGSLPAKPRYRCTRRSLYQRKRLRWDQTRRRRGSWRSIVLHPLLVPWV